MFGKQIITKELSIIIKKDIKYYIRLKLRFRGKILFIMTMKYQKDDVMKSLGMLPWNEGT